MKKNLIMRIASCLLVAVLVTSFLTGRLFAKYNTVAVGTSNVLVAKYSLYGNAYYVNSDGTFDDVVKTMNFARGSGTGNNAVRSVYFNDVYLLDNNGELDLTKKADIFVPEAAIIQGDSYFAPGTGGVSVLEIYNGGDVTLDVVVDFTFYHNGLSSTMQAKWEEVDADGAPIPLLKSDGQPSEYAGVWMGQRRDNVINFAGNADATIRLKYGERRYFKLYWRWPYSVGNEIGDTDLGVGNVLGKGDLATYMITFDVTQVD